MLRLPPAEPHASPGAAAAGLVALVFGLALFAPPAGLAAAESSEPAPLAAQSLLLDATRTGNRLVAVGDRGHVLLSDDEGRTWRQIVVPTRAMLTGVSFGDASHGWAVGAYGRAQLTFDGGQTWQAAAPAPDELHLNHLAPTGTDRIYVAGEAGTLLTSTDARTGWDVVNVPYDGSLYGTLPLGDRNLLVYGLRGRVFASEDAGQSWVARETQTPVLITAGLKLKSGVIVLAGLGGNFHLSRDGGRTFAHWQPADYTGGVSALLDATDGALVVVGEKGAARLQLPLK